MNPTTSQIESILAAAVEIPDAAARRAFVEQACAGNAELKRRVDEMVEDHFRAGSFLESPVADFPVPPSGDAPRMRTTLDQPIAERPGAVIGQYKLLEQIGEGGFGVVFMAEQTQPMRRKVALKVLKPGMDTRQVVARFEAERQALAIMDHPNIAKVFDGGATASGRPYFVMELVKGVPITEYCDQNHLTPRQRLELFVSVCQAVQHAHQKGIIHRDLKPSNVLVSRHDTTPIAKVIDFGVAKALGHELTEKTLFTGIAQMIGTPLYMSPEQAGMSDLDIDTRSDIYSLGVLLYELLTGTTPFAKERFKQAAYDEIRRIIREEEPPKPSTRLSESKDSLPSIAANRSLEPSKLSGMIRGELDWIVMKCLEKDRNRRYETANGLAMDLQNYLVDEPVLAGRPTVRYRLGKFLRRNRRTVMAAALLFAALLAGLAGTTWGMVQANTQRDRALFAEGKALEQEKTAKSNFELARSVVEEYCTKVSNDPRLKEKDLEELRKELLQLAVKFHQKFIEQHRDDPDLRADLGRAYHLLALLTSEIEDASKSIPLEEQALAAFQQLANSNPSEPEHQDWLAKCYNAMGNYFKEGGRYDQAVGAWREAVTLWKSLVAEHPTNPSFALGLGGAYCNLGFVLRQKKDLHGARECFVEAIRLLDPVCAGDPKDEMALKFLAHSSDNLAYNYRVTKQPEAGLPFALKALDLRKKLKHLRPGLPEHDGHTARTLQVLAFLYEDLGKAAQAEETLREAVTVSKRGAEQHPRLIEAQFHQFNALDNLGLFYLTRSEPTKAIPPLREAIALEEKFVVDFPTNTPYRIRLGKSWLKLVVVLTQTTAMEEGRRAFAEGLRVLEAIPKGEQQAFPEIREILLEAYPKYALFLGQLGRHAETAVAIDALLRLRDPPADCSYQAACALALACGAAARDNALAPAERKKLAGQYAVRALEMLKRADGVSFFNDPVRLRQLRTARELASLHSRDDFQQWLRALLGRPSK